MVKNNILNNDKIKNRNRQAVLALLKERGAMSRSELTKQLGCDGTTITNIIRSLDRDNFVKSLGSIPKNSRGRPKEIITLNENACTAIGISFSPRLLTGIVTNFNGRIIFQEKIYLEKGISRNVLENRVKQMANNLLDQSRPHRLTGIGIATFGIYIPENKTIARAEYFDAVCGIDFEKIFQDEFGIIPDITDGTTSRGIAEVWVKRPAVPSSFILLNVDVGVGCYIFVNSTPLVTGKGSNSEFGHMIMNPDGEVCEIGHRGCLETYAAVPAVEKKISQALDCPEVNFENIIEQYLNHDSLVMGIVNDSAKWLGVATSNLVNMFAPEEIILSGTIASFGQPYLKVLSDTVNKYAVPEFAKGIKFNISNISEEGPALGAALAQINKVFEAI